MTMQQHDDDEKSVHRISDTCKPCADVVGNTWISLGDLVNSIVNRLSIATTHGRHGGHDDDAKTDRDSDAK